jgi:hypothetical protein
VTQTELSLNLWVEAAVALAATLAFVLSALALIRSRHRDAALWHVLLGAAIYGAIFGIVIGFVITPLRALLLNGDLPPQFAAFSGLGVVTIMISLRRGLIGRLPFLGPQVRSYRRALLRRTIEVAQTELAKLTAKTA